MSGSVTNPSLDSSEISLLIGCNKNEEETNREQREDRIHERIRAPCHSQMSKLLYGSKLASYSSKTILSHEEALQMQITVKKRVVDQFLNIIKRYQKWGSSQPVLEKWGEEIEGMFYQYNEKGELQLLSRPFWDLYKQFSDFPALLSPQAWAFQWETIPKNPHTRNIGLYNIVTHIRQIYCELHSKSESLLCLPANMLMHKKQSPKSKDANWFSKSQMINDYSYVTQGLSKNLYGLFYSFYCFRSQNDFKIKAPLFHDVNTKIKEQNKSRSDPQQFIEMDSPIFAMYHSDLQTTFSSYNLDFICYLYDQFHILGPLMFAWSASSVIHDYKLCNDDSHFMMITEMFKDQRIPAEKDQNSSQYIPYGRYFPSNGYLWSGEFNKMEYGDIPINIDPQIEEYILKSVKDNKIQISQQLIKHLGYMMRIDTGMVRKDFADFLSTDIQQFQDFNKQIMPFIRLRNPIGGEGGWRIELRCKSIQLTSEYAAAMIMMDYLLVRLFENRRDINLYIPISLVHQNYRRGVKFDALKTQKFYFRTNVFHNGHPIIEQLYVSEILFGVRQFPGLIPLIKEELIHKQHSDNAKMILQLQRFFKQLTTGKLLTVAQWMRKFINNHPLYQHDSLISQELAEKLIIEMNEISRGLKNDPDLNLILI